MYKEGIMKKFNIGDQVSCIVGANRGKVYRIVDTNSYGYIQIEFRGRYQDPSNKFYMLWSPQGQRASTVRHFTLAEAEKEAQRLVEEVGLRDVYIMKAHKKCYKRSPIITEDIG